MWCSKQNPMISAAELICYILPLHPRCPPPPHLSPLADLLLLWTHPSRESPAGCSSVKVQTPEKVWTTFSPRSVYLKQILFSAHTQTVQLADCEEMLAQFNTVYWTTITSFNLPHMFWTFNPHRAANSFLLRGDSANYCTTEKCCHV